MRMIADCREFPSESNCSLTICGEPDEVVRAAAAHAVDVHGHTDDEDLRRAIRDLLRPEGAGRITGYGTAMIGKLRHGNSVDELGDVVEAWERKRQVPGFIGTQIMVADDGRTVINTAVFTDQAAYTRLADDPEQDAWYRGEIAPLLDGEPRWVDGQWAVTFRRPTRASGREQQTSVSG